ncbi:MAG: hypothetical protein ACXWWA_14550 [Chitinophagaceae bacterium]
MKKNNLIAILATVILFAGCKKTTDEGNNPQPEPDGPPFVTPIGSPAGTPVSKTIGSAGGTLVSPDGKLELNFPAGALAGNTVVKIQPVINYCPGGIGLAYHLMPDKIPFNKPVTLTYHYTANDINGSHPYFLFIAYQDSQRTWKADYKNRNVDTIAKTVSLGINHFSLWSLGDNLILVLDPSGEELYETETRAIRAKVQSRAAASGSDPGNEIYLPESTLLPDGAVSNWKINGDTSGNNLVGTISANGSLAVYTAPSSIENQRTVQVSAEINYPIVFFNNGRVVASNNKFILFKNLTLLPSVFDYTVTISYVDSAVAGYKPGQIYKDSASFDLSLKKTKDNMGLPTVLTVASNFKNFAPTVTPLTQTYADPFGVSTYTWEWIRDGVGLTNIIDVTLTSFDFDDSTVNFELIHSGTLHTGFNWHTSLGNAGTWPPQPFGGSQGLPQVMTMKLAPRNQADQWIKITAN